MTGKKCMMTSLFIGLALLFSLASTTSATVKPVTVAKEYEQVIDDIGDLQSGQKARQEIGFPYTPNGLLLILISAGLLLVTAGVGLKVFLATKRV